MPQPIKVEFHLIPSETYSHPSPLFFDPESTFFIPLLRFSFVPPIPHLYPSIEAASNVAYTKGIEGV